MSDWGEFGGGQSGVRPGAVRAVPAGSVVGGRRHARRLRASGPPAELKFGPTTAGARGGLRDSALSVVRGRRGQPRRVDPPLRPPGGARSIRWARRRSATRRSTPKRTASPRPSCGRCRRAWSAARSPRSRERLRRRSSCCARCTARASASTSRTSSCPKSASGCDITSRPAPSARRSSRSGTVELLDRITEVETFERFLHKTFVGKTRFSIEGLDMHGADPRRADRRFGRGGRQARAHRHGASRPAERARARDAEELRADPRRVQGSRWATSRSAKTSAGRAT